MRKSVTTLAALAAVFSMGAVGGVAGAETLSRDRTSFWRRRRRLAQMRPARCPYPVVAWSADRARRIPPEPVFRLRVAALRRPA